MTYEEARRILHPDTYAEAMSEIEYYAGFNRAEARYSALREAHLVACEALDRCIKHEELLDELSKEGFIRLCAKLEKSNRNLQRLLDDRESKLAEFEDLDAMISNLPN